DHRDLARELIGLAEDDRAAAAALLDVVGVSDAIGAFHAQQAVEKSLKAVLASRGVDFPFTHNLAALFQLCEDGGVEVPAELEEADRLTPYAVAARYGSRSPATVDRATALRFAAAAVRWAVGLVEP
ncbi:MAG TPA: HEPN domain-containing protein, partial [Solirubrobacteraceae bacterium]